MMRTFKRRTQQSPCLNLIVTDISVAGDTSCTHAPGANCQITISFRPTVFNVTGVVHYDWSASEGIDNGDHTNEVYTLTVTGSNETKSVTVTCNVTDDSGDTSTKTKSITLEFKEV